MSQNRNTEGSKPITSMFAPFSHKPVLIYVGTGFRTDVETLFDQFDKTNSIKFVSFAKCFVQMKFSLIFRGRQNDNEMRELLDELYLEVLSQLVNEQRPHNRRIACVYLLYCLYVKQPLDMSLKTRMDVKIRMTFAEWTTVKQFINQCIRLSHLEAPFIWAKLQSLNAINHVYYSYQSVGPSNTRLCHWLFRNSSSVTDNYANNLHTSLDDRLFELQMIHDGYVHMKNELKKPDNNPHNDAVPNVIKLELFGDTIGSLNKFVTDFIDYKKEYRGRGRPPLWLNAKNYEQRNDIIQNTEQFMKSFVAKSEPERRKTQISKKALREKQKMSVEEKILFTEEVVENIKQCKQNRRILKRKCKKEKID